MRIGNYQFMGPFAIGALGNEFLNFAGVYVIAGFDNSVLDVGQSEDINRRVTVDHKYDRGPDWLRHTGGVPPLVYALIEYDLWKRLRIEGELRATLNPLCGVR